MHANSREDVEVVQAGDIAAAVGLKKTRTGDTLCDKKDPIQLPAIEFPSPVIRVAVEPKAKGDEEKISTGLASLHEEDPAFNVVIDTPSDTVSGDYLVTLTGISDQVDSNPMQVRVTVNTPTEWGIYGFGIAIIIIIVLVLVFRKFRRR